MLLCITGINYISQFIHIENSRKIGMIFYNIAVFAVFEQNNYQNPRYRLVKYNQNMLKSDLNIIYSINCLLLL